MSKILYDIDTMQFSTLFETITQSRLKDCFKDETGVIFVVMPGYIAKAIGKKGVNVRKITNALKRPVKIVEYNPDVVQFIKNQVRVDGIEIRKEANSVIIKCKDTKTKGLVFGRERERLKALTSLVKRYFNIDEIRVE